MSPNNCCMSKTRNGEVVVVQPASTTADDHRAAGSRESPFDEEEENEPNAGGTTTSTISVNHGANIHQTSQDENDANVEVESLLLHETIKQFLDQHLISEEWIPYEERPFASSTDCLLLLRPRQNEEHLRTITEQFINTICGRGCHSVHLLRECSSTRSSSSNHINGNQQGAFSSSPSAAAGEARPHPRLKNGDDNGVNDNSSISNDNAPTHNVILRQRSMIVWENERLQTYNMNQSDTADYLAEALEMCMEFPKITFWIQVQGKLLEDKLRRMIGEQQQQQQQQQEEEPMDWPRTTMSDDGINNHNKCNEVFYLSPSNYVPSSSSGSPVLKTPAATVSSAVISNNNSPQEQHPSNMSKNKSLFVRSKIWKWSNQLLADKCLVYLIHLRQLAISNTKTLPSGAAVSASSSLLANQEDCLEYDLYVAQNLDNPHDILEYSVWRNVDTYKANFEHDPKVQQILNCLHTMEAQQQQSSTNPVAKEDLPPCQWQMFHSS